MDMEITINEIKNHCEYCLNKSTNKCQRCIGTNDYIAVPTGFKVDPTLHKDEILKFVSKYFYILSEHTELLHKLLNKSIR